MIALVSVTLGLKEKTFDNSRVSITVDLKGKNLVALVSITLGLKEKTFASSGFYYSRFERGNLS